MNAILDKLSTMRGNKNKPQNIPVQVVVFASLDNCFPNVLKQVEREGGMIIYGWKLYSSSIMEEAERHAVWYSPKNELVDITPNRTNSINTIFVQEDKGWAFDGAYTDNIRVNITDNPLVDDLILLCETITKLCQTGKRKSIAELVLKKPVAELISLLEKDKKLRLIFIYSGKKPSDNCYCGAADTYRKCHGHNLESIYSEALKIAVQLN